MYSVPQGALFFSRLHTWLEKNHIHTKSKSVMRERDGWGIESFFLSQLKEKSVRFIFK